MCTTMLKWIYEQMQLAIYFICKKQFEKEIILKLKSTEVHKITDEE